MINWFNMSDEGLSNGGLFEVKELEVTENGTYETKGEMYNKVTVNVEGGGGGESDFTIANVNIVANRTGNGRAALYMEGVADVSQGEMRVNPIIMNGVALQVILYKGQELYPGLDIVPAPGSTAEINSVNVDGDAEYDEHGPIIKGDCTITINYTAS